MFITCMMCCWSSNITDFMGNIRIKMHLLVDCILYISPTNTIFSFLCSFEQYGEMPGTNYGIGIVPDAAPSLVPQEMPTLTTGRLYVGNLAWNVAWQDLKDYFKKCGHVVRADVMIGADGRSKGCGLVEFETVEEAMGAIARLNDTELKGRRMFVREDRENPPANTAIRPYDSRPRGAHRSDRADPATTCSVFVGNLPWDVSWQQLKDHFRDTCDLQARRVEVMESPNGRSKGYGIVKFDTPEEARDAVEKMAGSQIGGRILQIRLDRG
jgi:RNA recognition motif-containing protein